MTTGAGGGRNYLIGRGKSAGFTVTLPAGWIVTIGTGRIAMRNRHASNSATGIKIGLSSGSAEIMAATNVAADALVLGNSMASPFAITDTTLFVTGTFNSSLIDIKIPIERGIVGKLA